MSLRWNILGVSAVALAALFFTGCSSAPENGQDSGDDEMHMDGGHADHGDMHHDDGGDDDQAKIEENLGKLSEADRVLAEKQKICPVTEGLLGAMNKPIKLEVEGKELFICCPDCEEAIRKEPDKYLAKIYHD